MQNESSRREILVSKIIVGIFAIYVLYTMGGNLYNIRLPNKNLPNGEIIILTSFIFLIFQILILAKIFRKKSSKYKFTNFERKFHPFFKDENQDVLLFEYLLISIGSFVIWFVLPYIIEYFNKGAIKWDIPSLFAVYVYLGIISAVNKRNKILDTLPIKFMESNKLSLILEYEDYINKRIIDDEPHLYLNQSFEFQLKNLPRNDSEKNTIEIRNNHTPVNSALVARIEDYGLANAIRNGSVIKSRLVSIREFANLEIEISIHKTP